MSAALGVALAAVLLLGAVSTPLLLAAAVLLVQGTVVARWYAALDVPGERGGAVVAALAALTADGLVVTHAGPRPMSPVAAVAAGAVLAALLHQLGRRHGRPRLTASLAATVTLAGLVVLGAGYLAGAAGDGGAATVAAAAVSVALVLASTALPGPRRVVRSAGTAAALLAGSAVAMVASPLGLAVLAVPAAAVATAWVALVVAARAQVPDPWLSAGLPFLAAGPVVFVLARLLAT
ncbi:MAG: hypothetical protein QOI54_2688 [Actinomycetota bacterium]|jgi:hypothetical protein|nr:hypothetical protein [Actinomycetota bacterium]